MSLVVAGGSGHERPRRRSERFRKVEPVPRFGRVVASKGRHGVEAPWISSLLHTAKTVPRARDAPGPSDIPAHASGGESGADGIIDRVEVEEYCATPSAVFDETV